MAQILFFSENTQHFSFDGDGMIHAIYLAEGKAHYRNRYVETSGLLRERRAGKALYSSVLNPKPIEPEWALPEDGPVARKNSASMHIISHAGKYLALFEGHPAYEITAQLNTVGEWKPADAKQPLSVCAHTRKDPETGDLWLVNYGLVPPYLTIHCVNNQGAVTKSITIDKSYSSMVHDFVLTKQYIIIFDCPVVFDLKRALSGKSVIQWQPELEVRIGIISRDGEEIRWFNTAPFFVFHFVNACESEHEIIVDYVRHEHGDFFSGNSNIQKPSPKLYRTIINLNTGIVSHILLEDRIVEFPCINENYHAKSYQYSYALTSTVNQDMNAIIKFDVIQQRSYIHEFAQPIQLSEAVFAPRKNAQTEDDGYLLLFVCHMVSMHSEFVIFDAKNITQPPLARVQLPDRVPRGFHGSWIPMENLT